MNSSAIWFLCVISVFLRIITSTESVDLLIASVNCLALLIIAFSIGEDIEKELSKTYSSKPALRGIFKRKVKYFKKHRSIFLFFIFVLSCLYVFFWKTALANDIISIVSLSISITASKISKKITTFIMDMK